MKSRAMTVGLAMLLAFLATAGVFLYVRNVREQATSGSDTVRVVASTTDIPAGTELDPLITNGVFTTRVVREKDVIAGALVNVEQLRGRTAAYPILAGEQVTPARLRGAAQAPGGLLGIPSGHQALSLSLEPQQLVGGAVQTGDRVAVYGTVDIEFQEGSKPRLTVTRVLVPEVEVLRAVTPAQGAAAGQNKSVIVLALKAYDAELVLHVHERGKVWLGLLPPNEKGTRPRLVTPQRLLV
jgi:Flp pilus assembly protein CpaB